jgi:LuxR family glucitol operon transcriptional activator
MIQVNRKDIGYAVYSRLEEGLRTWIGSNLLNFGDEWRDRIPAGVWNKAEEKSPLVSRDDADDPADLLDETDIPDLAEIVSYKGAFRRFMPPDTLAQREFQDLMASLYDLRCKIAHVKQSFTAIDLDLLIETAERFLAVIGRHGDELCETLECIRANPLSVVVSIPPDFFLDGELMVPHLHNLPPSDYDADGGFIGRKQDLKKIKSLVLGDLDRVITISGAGGVGKTALAHRFCVSLLQQRAMPFDAVVWISAKEEKLTLTGIEPIETSVRNYEELLDSILEVYGWFDALAADVSSKEEDIDLILRAGDKGVLLVVDNLETIEDERILEFIKDIPRPNKVLITSRMGLGEVERRYPLREMSKTDASSLIRTVAKEKGVDNLVKLPDDVLHKYAQRMSSYPLAIKWVIGQVALGKDIDQVVDKLVSTSGDVARFCFDHIYDNLLGDNAKMVLHCLTASDSPLTRGVLTHVSGLRAEELDGALRDLALASLVILEQEKGEDDTIITRYSLLPLTLGYLRARLQAQPEVYRTIQARMELVGNRMEEAARAAKQYRYTLQHLGATTDEERIAASWALTAYQKHQMGDYNGATEAYRRAVEIAPGFSSVYRNWAAMESADGYYARADELMEKATGLSPEDPSLWFVWGNIEKRRGRLDRARTYLRKALTLSPNDGAVLGGLGEVEKRSGNYEEAHGYFGRALAVPPEVRSYKHEVITHTAIADNLRRWADALWRDKQSEAALSRVKEAYEHAKCATGMATSDMRARDTLRKVALELAILLAESEGIDVALPFFREAIVERARRVKDKKTTSQACYRLSWKLLETGRRDEAERYYRLGNRALLPGSSLKNRYERLRSALFEDRFTGRISYVPANASYGFIEREDTPGQSVFVHRTEMIPPVSPRELKDLRGATVSFAVEETEKGPQARNVRVIDES